MFLFGQALNAPQLGDEVTKRVVITVIVAAVALGALRIAWRAVSRAEPTNSSTEWTADE